MTIDFIAILLQGLCEKFSCLGKRPRNIRDIFEIQGVPESGLGHVICLLPFFLSSNEMIERQKAFQYFVDVRYSGSRFKS